VADPRPAWRRARERAGAVEELRAELAATTAELSRLRRTRAGAARLADPRRPAPDVEAADAAITKTTATIAELRDRLRDAERRLSDATTRFEEASDPRPAIGRLDRGTPLLLMPLRIETRFMPDELWVRVYPDQWAVDGFEVNLTDTEVLNASRFWASMFRAGGDDGMRRAAWRTLVAASGSGRAGWVIDQLRPLNPGDEPVRTDPAEVILVVAGEVRLDAAAKAATATYWERRWRAGGVDGDGELETALRAAVGDATADIVLTAVPHAFDERPSAVDPAAATITVAFCELPAAGTLTTKTSSWTQAARANVLPDRIVLLGFRAGKQVLEAVGRQIPASLSVGPDPSAGPSEQFAVVEGELVVPDELRWMVDFDAAVDIGLAMRVALDAGAEGGFDRLFALGLRIGATAAEDQADLEQLLAHHHRSRAGMSIVAQGTPTNNTEGVPSGFDRLDDSDLSYDRYLGGGGLVDEPSWSAKPDGQWLAECIGIDPGVLAAVAGADGSDQAEARAMNTALWPATWGYFLESMLHPLLTDRQVEQVRSLFIDYVSGRGRVPALRLGRQPYGIIPTTAFGKLRFGTGLRPDVRTLPDRAVLDALHAMLTTIVADLAPSTAAIPHAHGGGDAHQTLLDIVALHPASVEFHQRYAESIADIFNRFRFDNLGGEFLQVWQALGQMAAGRQLLARLGYTGAASPDLIDKLFHSSQHRLSGPAVDDRPLSEEATVRAYCDDGRNYLHWLADTGRSSLDDLREENGFTGDQEPTALLYVLLRHAVMLSWWDTAVRLRLDAGLIDEAAMIAARHEPAFVHVTGAARTESRWLPLYDGAAPITGNDRQPLHEAIPGLFGAVPTRHLADVVEAIRTLAGVPTARLERLLAEHLDCCSHRVDAWRLGLVTRRLLDLRGIKSTTGATPTKPKRGVHLGAYGWLHDVRPEPRKLLPVELPKELEPAFAKGAPLQRDTTNGGFVHAPSLNHAATAAILRSGFMANTSAAHPDTMAVNLSSERMRLATSVLEGLRNGQTLAALLGYRFERGLHDRHGLAEVDAFIHPLRLEFPIDGDRDAHLAVDGVQLVRHVQQPGRHNYPFGLADLPPASTAQRQAIDLEVERLLDVYDAVADVVLAEGVHQAVLGNFDRVASTLDAVGRAGIPREPAVLETPDTGIALTHRVAVHLHTGLDHLTSPVAGVAMTPRAIAEPAVNELLAAMLPPPADVVVRVRWTDPDGTARDRLVTQAELGLQPIDLFAVLRLESDAAMGELDERILQLVTLAEGLRPDVAAVAHFTERVPGRTTFFELAPLVGHLRTLVTTGRPLRPSDVARAGDASSAADTLVHADRARPAEVVAQLDAHITVLQDRRDALDGLLTDRDANRIALLAGVDGFVNGAADALVASGRFGMPSGGWSRLNTTRSVIFADLLGVVGAAADRWRARLARADAALAREQALDSVATDGERVAALLLAERELRAAPTSPLPTDPAAYRTAIGTQRTAFTGRLADLDAAGAATGLADALDRVAALLPLDAFDAQPLSIVAIENRAIDLCADAARSLGEMATVAGERSTAAASQLAAHDAAAPGRPRVGALTAAVKALLGPDAVFVPEFDLAPEQGDEWDAAYQWARGGGLFAALPTRPLPVDDWLHGVARVRDKVRAWEQATLLASAFGRPEPELTPSQFPHAAEPWWALEWPASVTLPGERLLYTAHYPAALDTSRSQAGLLIDEWVEVVPGDTATTGVVFHYDAPNSEPPQAMLLVVPPDPSRGWEWDDVVDALHDTLDLARLRAIEPEAIAATAYAAFVPATVSEATVRGFGISANHAVNNDLYRHLRVDNA
jgi:hypothetical protein